MMIVIPKWRVTVLFGGERGPLIFWISDTQLSNALRKLADLSFTEGMEQPRGITVDDGGRAAE